MSTSRSPAPPHSSSLRCAPFMQWNALAMNKAIEAVERGESIRQASIKYNIPKSTLYDRVSGKITLDSKPGRKPYLSVEEEEELVSFLVKCAQIGYARTRLEVLTLVCRIVESKGVESVEHVTDSWWRRFRERHPQLTLWTAMPLSYARAMATDEHVINQYFDILEATLTDNGILDHPHCIFNCDETGMPLNPKSLKVVDVVGAKHPSYVTGNGKDQITVLACTNAAGSTLPPFVIFDRQTLTPSMTKGEVPSSSYGLSSKGWINQGLFSDWFNKHFLVHCTPVRPILLLLDGHSSHYCPDFIRVASRSTHAKRNAAFPAMSEIAQMNVNPRINIDCMRGA